MRNEEYLVPCGETLLIADGEGRNSVYLAKNGFKVTSSDSSIVAQQKAKVLADSQNVKVNFRLENFFDIDWSKKQYDNIIGICFQFIPPLWDDLDPWIYSWNRLFNVSSFVYQRNPTKPNIRRSWSQ